MDVLVLGGSVFLGRAVVDEALNAGHRVTVFNRGRSGEPAPAGVTEIRGDRTRRDDVLPLAQARFDLVVDTSGYVPAEVAMSADVVHETAAFYAFISTINAFPGWPDESDYTVGGIHDGDPDASAADVPDGSDANELYGWRKVGCERAVERAFGAEHCSVLRGGAIVGPSDGAVGRLPWWLDRIARGGEVLVPGRADATVALIDARDLARFALSRVPGTFETPGPPGRDTRQNLMTSCRDATGSDATFTYIDDEDWLLGQGVEPWTELPLWGPTATMPSLFAHHAEASVAAGLRWRPLADTVADTWAWQRALPSWSPTSGTPGLPSNRERELLAAWHERNEAPVRG